MARVNAKPKQRIKEKDERRPELSPVEQPEEKKRAGPLTSSRARLLCAAGVFLVSLFVYVWTLAPTVTLVDSGELIIAARVLGVAHPPGFPLYVLLAHLATLVPFGNIAVRVNFASALFAAASAGMLTLVVAELMLTSPLVAAFIERARKKSARKNKKVSPAAESPKTPGSLVSNSLLVLIPALTSGLLLAFSRTLWAYATIAEVYTLNTLLILIIFFLMLRWRRRILEDERRKSERADASVSSLVIRDHDNLLYLAAIVFGLALGVHHVTVALLLPALGVLVYRTEGVGFFKSKRLLYAALVSFAALFVIYAYLPLAALRAPLMNWGNPRSLEGIWWHITGKQYQAFLTFSPDVMAQQLVEFARLAGREFGRWWLPLALVLALIGLIDAFKRERTTFWFLLLVMLCNMAYALNYEIAEDKDAYYLPTFIALAVAAGLGVRWFVEHAATKPVLASRLYAWAALPVLLVPLVAFAFNLPFDNRSRYFIAHDYVENILSTMEPNGLLLTLDWQVESPMLYTREIEQRRLDIKVVDVNLLRRSWYFDYLKRAYPTLIERSHEQVDAFVTDLKQWEHDPEVYANSAALSQRIDTRFHEMIQSFVTNQLADGPAYVTSDLVFQTEAQDRELTEWFYKNYQLVPRGLIFKLAGLKQGFQDSPEAHLETRGLVDGTLRFEPDDVVNLKVLPVYKMMYFNRGRYLALYDQHERAIEAFKQALALDPNFEMAEQAKDESMKKLREAGASGAK
jgi:tetratricopeptide (TPR) repeat protein